MILDRPEFSEVPEEAAAVPEGTPVEDVPALWDLDQEAWWHWYLDHDACREATRVLLEQAAAGTVPLIATWSGWTDEVVLAVREHPSVAARLEVDPGTVAAWRVAPEAAERARGEREQREKGERDEWAGYLAVEVKERDELMARWRIPFRVLAVRRRHVPSHAPGLGPKDSWELLVARCPLNVKMYFRIPPGNDQRDRQLEWLREHAPLEQPLCLYHEELSGGRRRLSLTRCEWWDEDERWQRLPKSVRKLLLKEG